MMNDKDLNTLKDLNTPAPDMDAKTRAMEAALAAFDEQEFEKTPQGNTDRPRLITRTLETIGEWIMKRRIVIGSAVTAAIALPAALYIFADQIGVKHEKQYILSRPASEETQKAKPAKPAKFSDRLSKRSSGIDTYLKKDAPLVAGREPKLENRASKLIIVDRRRRSERKAVNASTRADSRDTSSELLSLSQDKAPGLGQQLTEEPNNDIFTQVPDNNLKSVSEHPVSTFSIDVDTASYAFMRRALNRGVMPNRNSVRVEELINYFSYDYPKPDNSETPFKTSVAVYQTPWNPDTKLLHIGLKGYDIKPEAKPQTNLVFLIDVSGSMSAKDKLPLLKSAFRLLVDRLDPDDTIAIVTYAGRAGTALKPTKVAEKRKILEALDNLHSGGSTAGEQGIKQAYALAREAYKKDGVNRVILATDGDFNVGTTNRDELKKLVEQERKSGVLLSVMGFGQGNYNDALMQTLAQNGNGSAAYIDTLKEAQKVLVEEAGSTLFPIAKDVKIQIEFNAAKVSEYRLIGYETRKLKRQDFNNDKVDAGDIGSGHTVTAIYEITPVGSPAQQIDNLRYAANRKEAEKVSKAADNTNEYAFLKLRYKLPKENKSKLITTPVTTAHQVELSEASSDIRFATSVAAYGQKLRGSQQLDDFTYDDIHKLASASRGKDEFGYRSEFLSLIRLAKSLDKKNRNQ